MDDGEVIDGFVAGGAVQAFGSRLHVEGDALVLDGWWKSGFRVSPSTFAVRDEPAPVETTVADDLAGALAGRGLVRVGADPTLLLVILYSAIDLGPSEWVLWSTDDATCSADLAARAGEDRFLDDVGPGIGGAEYTAGVGGLRRLAGLAPMVLLTVGIDDGTVAKLAAGLGNCRVESRPLGGITTDQVGAVMANLVLVDATGDAGKEFALELRLSPAGESLPLAAVSDAMFLPGADMVVEPGADPAEWAEHLRALLP